LSDLGLTHVALPTADAAASIAFYARYARMKVLNDTAATETHREVVWLCDGTRPFVVVLIEVPRVEAPLQPLGHLGVGCASREEVDRLADAARDEGRLRLGPLDSGYPVGYWALLADPDGHTLELSHGQEVALTVERELPPGGDEPA